MDSKNLNLNEVDLLKFIYVYWEGHENLTKSFTYIYLLNIKFKWKIL